MRINDNGIYRDMTEEEVAEMQRQAPSIDYSEAVDHAILERYSLSQDFEILRQRDSKPDEYAEYYAYCEECKNRVKRIMSESSFNKE